MKKKENIKRNYAFWITRYSLIQIGNYCVSLFTHILYLVPILNNDLVLYSYLISNISILRLRIYLNDVIAFLPKGKRNKILLFKKLVIYINLFLVNILIYLYLAKINFLASLSLTISLIIGIYIGYLNNSNLHSLIRENTISKRNLFMFGFLPRFISTILLFIYILFIKYFGSIEELINYKLILIAGMNILPPTIYRIFFLNKPPFKKAIKKLISFPQDFKILDKKSFFYFSNINFISLLIINFLFFIIIVKLTPQNEGNIFNLPISITLILNLLLLASRIQTAKKYSLNNYMKTNITENILYILPLTCLSIFLFTIFTNNFYILYCLALISYIITIATIHFEKDIILNKMNQID